MLKINSQKELMSFLRKITKQSIVESKNQLSEKKGEDPFVTYFYDSKKNDGLLDEQDEAPTEAPPENKKPDQTDEKEEEQPDKEKSAEKPDLNPAAEKALSFRIEDGKINPTFESVIEAINLVRAGRSLKDKEIKDGLESYYRRLNENERGVLMLFLEEISKILTGAISGKEAQDPSDPRTYFKIIKKEKEQEAQPKIDPAQAAPQAGQKSGPEDTSPPIKVGGEQDLQELKYQIKKMMLG